MAGVQSGKEIHRDVQRLTGFTVASEKIGGVPSQSLTILFNDSQLKDRECFWMIDHPVLGPFPHPSPSFLLSGTPAAPRLPAPCLGLHTKFICEEFLKISDKEFAQPFEKGVFK